MLVKIKCKIKLTITASIAMSALLISCNAPSAPPAGLLAFDSAFLATHTDPYALRYSSDTPDALSFWLAQQVVSEPLNLILHVRRILWHEQRGEVDALTGALVDLFIALGTKGTPLRKRFLKRVQGKIPDQWKSVLEQHFNEDLTTVALPSLPIWSRLMPCAGLRDVLQIRSKATVNSQSTLEEVRDLIDSGLLTQAQSQLERAIIAAPQDPALHYELIALYRSTRNSTRAEPLYHQLAPSLSPELATAWHELGKSLNF